MDFERTQHLKKLPLQKVDSSHIESVAHDPTSSTLVVKFKRGSVYAYAPVTVEAFRELMNAPSKGTYIHEKIKSNNSIVYTKLD